VLHWPTTEPREGAFSCIISCDGARALVETAFTGNGEFVASVRIMLAYMEAG
jgi:hypothetical protein